MLYPRLEHDYYCRHVLQLPCRVRACCRGRAGRSASLPAVATVARAANRGPRRAAERVGFGANEAVSGVGGDELGAPPSSPPQPSPKTAERPHCTPAHCTSPCALRAEASGPGPSQGSLAETDRGSFFSARPALFPLSPAHPRLVSPLPSRVTYLNGTRRLPRSPTTSGLRPAGFTGLDREPPPTRGGVNQLTS